jgi:hypothetical protein
MYMKNNGTRQPASRSNRQSERGNVFFTLFGAVAILGVLGAGIVATMRGPLTTMVEVNRQEQAKAELRNNASFVLLSASDDACEAAPDGYTEGPAPETPISPALVGGGAIPASIAAVKNDPWGTPYGYCAWDHGDIAANQDGCDAGTHLSGNTSTNNIAVAIISAGPDREFQTDCLDDPTYLSDIEGEGDDLVNAITYTGAVEGSDGLWTVVDADTAGIEKDIQVGGDIVIDPTGSGTGQLQLGAQSMLLPDHNELVACNPGNNLLPRVNDSGPFPIIEICDGDNSRWIPSGSLWSIKSDGEIFFNSDFVGIGNNDPTVPLEVTGNTILDGQALITNILTLNEGIVMKDSKSILWDTGDASIVGNSGTLELTNAAGTTVTLDNNALEVTGDTIITGKSAAAGSALLVQNSTPSPVIVAQNDGNVAIGAASANDRLHVEGAVDTIDGYKIDDALILDTVGTSTLLGYGAGINTTGSANTLLGTETGKALITGDNNILIGSVVDVPDGATSDYLNIGNILHGSRATKRLGVGYADTYDAALLNHTLNVNGSLYVNTTAEIDGILTMDGNIVATDGTVDIDDNLAVTGDISGTDLSASEYVFVDGAQLGPPPECAIEDKLSWDDAGGWSCVDDQGGSGSGGTARLDEVLTAGNDADEQDAENFGSIGADFFCNADLSVCFDPTSAGGIFEVDDGSSPTLVRTNNASAPHATVDFVFGAPTLASAVGIDDDARIFFDKSKGAFGAGSATAAQWDTAGNFSAVFGLDNTASGTYSAAFGYLMRATNSYAFAAGGTNSHASGNSSVVLGSGLIASGQAATAIGAESSASADYSMALGRHVTAGAQHTLAIGLGNPGNGTKPSVTGTNAMAIFMGNHPSVAMATANTMGIFGGNVIVDPAVPATNLAPSEHEDSDGNDYLAMDIHGYLGAVKYCDEEGDDCFESADIAGGNLGIWQPDGTSNYIEYDDALGGVRIGAVSGQPAPESDWGYNIATSTVSTISNTVAIGSAATATGGDSDLILDVTGAAGADEYCDSNGDDCFTASEIANIEDAFIQDGNSFGALATLGTNDNNALAFETNAIEQMRIATDGEVGIGTTDPQATLDIAKTGGAPTLRLSNAGHSDSPKITFHHLAPNRTGEIEVTDNTGLAVASVGVYRGHSGEENGIKLRAGTAANPNTYFNLKTLAADTGDSVAARLTYRPEKATSGNDTGLLIEQTDIQTPGTSWLIDAKRDTVSQFWVENTGLVYARSAIAVNTTTTSEHEDSDGDDYLALDVHGYVGAEKYCDEEGDNCFSAVDASGSGVFEVTGGAGTEVVRQVAANAPLATSDFLFGATTLDYDSANASRMFFDKSKSAFRAGTAATTDWDTAQIGTGSVAFGDAARASGDYSFAMGNSTVRASAANAFAFGASSTQASGGGSFAMGNFALASAGNAFSFGYHTNASNSYSVAIGHQAIASGVQSFAFGREIIAGDGTQTAVVPTAGEGQYSIALGLGNPTTASSAEYPRVTGNGSLAAFSGDQASVNVDAENVAAFLGMSMIINPDITSATPAVPSTAGAGLELHVVGDIGAAQYCDEAGDNCFTAATAAGGGVFEVTGGAGTELVRQVAASAPLLTSDFLFGSTQLADTGNADHDARMFFDKSRGAFRAGAVNSTQWDDINVGDYSVVFGNDNRANGSRSASWGSANVSSAGWTTTFGNGNAASQSYATAFGNSTVASGSHSTAFGYDTNATGEGSTAWGGNKTGTVPGGTASGLTSTAFGLQTIASGINSLAFGNQATAGSGTAADGAGDYSVALGLQSAAQATDPKVTGDRSMVLFFDANTADANSAYSFSDSDKFALIGGEFQIDNQSSTANKGCIRYNSDDTKLEFSHDCSAYAEFGASSGGPFTRVASKVIPDATVVTLATDDYIFGSIAQDNDVADVNDDNRMYYDKSKNAFRAVNTADADTNRRAFHNDANVGNHSAAFGNLTLASGAGSFAAGSYTRATSSAASAFGNSVFAQGLYSFAAGNGIYVAGTTSIALGNEVMVGDYAGSLPINPTTVGQFSMAFGLGESSGNNPNASPNQYPAVTGNGSVGFFSGDQVDTFVSADNTAAFLGLKMIINPDTSSATPSVPATTGAGLELHVVGDIGAAQYCDEAGANCFAPASAGGTFEVTGGAGTEVVRQIAAKAPLATSDFVFGATTLDYDGANAHRMFFDKSKGAFRAGTNSGTTWNDVSRGTNSAAFGKDTIASGSYSMVWGDINRATATNSTAWGNNAAATGATSTAIGLDVNASGVRSIAIGLGDSTGAGLAQHPEVTAAGIGSIAFFMGDQKLVDVATPNIMAILGGEVIIDPAEPATNLVPSTHEDAGTLALDVHGYIGADKYCDEAGNDCFSSTDVGGGVFEVTGGAGTELVRQVAANAPLATSDFLFGGTSLDNQLGGDDDKRMYFDKDKAAFRAGWSAGTEWDASTASVGTFSAAFGLGVTASGDGSMAWGNADSNPIVASGVGSLAFGLTVDHAITASESGSIAAGYANNGAITANQPGAFARGHADAAAIIASGAGSTAFGDAKNYDITASGPGSLAFGSTKTAAVTASGAGSAAWGDGAIAAGGASTAFGMNVTTAADGAIAMGNQATASGTHSMAIGLGTASVDPVPEVSGEGSLGIFMGDQNGVDLTANDTMAIMGGKLGLGTVTPSTTMHIVDQAPMLQIEMDENILGGFSILTKGDGASGFAAVGNKAWAWFAFGDSFIVPNNLGFYYYDNGTSHVIEYIDSTTRNRTFGAGTIATGKIDIYNTIDQPTLITRAHSTQTSDIFQIYNSSGAKSVWVNNSGHVQGHTFVTDDTTVSANRGCVRYRSAATRLQFSHDCSVGVPTYVDMGTAALSDITAATKANSIDNTNFAQAWTWNTAGNYNALSMSTTGIAKGNVLTLTNSNTAVGATGSVISLNATGATGAVVPLYVNNLGTGNTVYMIDGPFDATPFVIDNAGRVGIGIVAPSVALDVNGDIEFTGVITDVSDIRLKQDIKPLEDRGSMLEKIGMIDTYSFVMKETETSQNKPGRTEFGVIAQDIERIFPELVSIADDDMKTMSVNYIGLIAPMIKATQELKAENESLSAQLAAMNDQQASLQGAVENLSAQVDILNRLSGQNLRQASFFGGPLGMLALILVCSGGAYSLGRRYRNTSISSGE